MKLGYFYFDLALTQPYLLLFSASLCAAVYYKFHQSPDIDLASATFMTDQRRSRPCEWISAASAVASLERRLASQTPARRIAHTHARTGRYCGTRWMRLEAGNNFAHLPQSGFKFELSEAEETEKGSKKKCIIAREREKERRWRVGTQANWVAAVVGLVWVLDLAQSAEPALFRFDSAFVFFFLFCVDLGCSLCMCVMCV